MRTSARRTTASSQTTSGTWRTTRSTTPMTTFIPTIAWCTSWWHRTPHLAQVLSNHIVISMSSMAHSLWLDLSLLPLLFLPVFLRLLPPQRAVPWARQPDRHGKSALLRRHWEWGRLGRLPLLHRNSELLWSVQRSLSTLACSESKNSALPRFWIAAWYTEYYGYFRKCFWTNTCSRRTTLNSLRKFKEFGIIFSRIETWHCRKYNGTGRELRQEPQNSSIPVPRFPRGGGILNHFGGNYDMMDYARFPISKIHRGQIPNSMEWQSWKVNFKTEVCSETADPHLTMHWIEEVRMAKSIDELATSRSILERTDIPDQDMLDAMVASALKSCSTRRFTSEKRVSVEEQRAQKYDRFLQVRQNCLHDLQSFSCNQILWSSTRDSDLFSIRLQNDDVQDFYVRWDQALLSASDMPSDPILERLYKLKLQKSAQHRTVMALYDQKVARNKWTPNYQQLKLQWNFMLIRWWEIGTSKPGTVRWFQTLLWASEIPREMILEGLCASQN